MGLIVSLLIIQVLLLAVVIFGDIGFDKPGRYGLSWGHLLVIGAVYAVVLGAGLFLAVRGKAWGWAGAQALLPVFYVLYLSRPTKAFDPDQYQHLVGKTMEEVEAALGNPKGASFGAGGDCPGRSFLSFKGMTICFSEDGVAVEVRKPSI